MKNLMCLASFTILLISCTTIDGDFGPHFKSDAEVKSRKLVLLNEVKNMGVSSKIDPTNLYVIANGGLLTGASIQGGYQEGYARWDGEIDLENKHYTYHIEGDTYKAANGYLKDVQIKTSADGLDFFKFSLEKKGTLPLMLFEFEFKGHGYKVEMTTMSVPGRTFGILTSREIIQGVPFFDSSCLSFPDQRFVIIDKQSQSIVAELQDDKVSVLSAPSVQEPLMVVLGICRALAFDKVSYVDGSF